MIKVTFDPASADQIVETVSGLLHDQGFAYDEDFTTLYASGWKVSGLQFMGPRGAQAHSQAAQYIHENWSAEVA